MFKIEIFKNTNFYITNLKMDKMKFFGAREETLVHLKELYRVNFEIRKENSKLRKRMYLQEYERLKKYFKDIDKGGCVLDIGCGVGDFLSLFNKHWEKYGIEISSCAREIAQKKGIITDFELKDNFFDLIIFRGTIQHIPDPIYKINECRYWLKKGGMLIFLATPNTNSIVYKLFNNLPMLNRNLNFLLPSDKMLEQILTNNGFNIVAFEYPYKNTPYAHRIKDILSFILKLLRIKKKIDFPFYGNVMECYAKIN